MTTDLKLLAEDITKSLSGCGSPHCKPYRRAVVTDTKTGKVLGYMPGDQMMKLVKKMRILEGTLDKATT